MKVGDFVNIPIGVGSHRIDGLLLAVRDNPADTRWKPQSAPAGEWPRKIVDVMGVDGLEYTAWALSVKVLLKGEDNENR